VSPRDTNVYLDGIEVPLAFHFFGITSFYPASQLASLEVQNGGFGVEHGRGQGGLVALTSRAPRSDGWQAGGEVSIVDASAHAEGPTGGLGAISVAVRRSYIDGILRAVLSEDDRFLPRYYDAQVRWDVGDARERGALTAWLFTSNDELLGDEARFGQSFVRLAARYLRQVDRTTVAITPWAGLDRREFVGEGGDDEPDTELGRTSVPLGLRASITRDAGWGHVAAGLDLQGGRYGRLAIGTDDPMDGDAPMVTRPRDYRWAADTALWVEGRWRLDGERLAATAGLRLERYGLARQWVLDPRLLVSQRLSSRLTLRTRSGCTTSRRPRPTPIPSWATPRSTARSRCKARPGSAGAARSTSSWARPRSPAAAGTRPPRSRRRAARASSSTSSRARAWARRCSSCSRSSSARSSTATTSAAPAASASSSASSARPSGRW
jgi:hypothetical protein